jgi:asparagine synthase (glutamine-hydrolysing)
VFGGYQHYQQSLIDKARLGWIPISILKTAAKLAARMPAGVRGRNRLASLRGGIAKGYIWGTPYFDIELRKRILHPDVFQTLKDGFDIPELFLLSLAEHGQDEVDALMRTDFGSVLPDDYLVKVDRASMANSLEVRSPFLDYRLVGYAYGRIPTKWKATRFERRRVQNIMAKKYLPEDFVLNRKQGFSIPMDQWLRKSDIRTRLQTLPREIINHREVERLVLGLMKGRANGARLFGLLMLGVGLKNLATAWDRK